MRVLHLIRYWLFGDATETELWAARMVIHVIMEAVANKEDAKAPAASPDKLLSFFSVNPLRLYYILVQEIQYRKGGELSYLFFLRAYSATAKLLVDRYEEATKTDAL